MGGAVSSGTDNDDLIDNLVEGHYIKTVNLQKVFRAVDRALYFLPEWRHAAYRDSAWKEGHIHISAPCIYAEVMESLNLAPGMSFLNIGSGTGYLSTMVGCVLGSNGVNHGVEQFESNVKYANERLQHFWKTSVALRYFDFTPPKFVVGNGLKLSCEFMDRYDRMYVGSACAEEEEVQTLAKCLKINGLMIVPINDHLVRVTRVGANEFKRENLMQCSFASLVSPSADAETVRLPVTSLPSLKYVCRTVVVRALRSRILHENPELSMPRCNNRHMGPRKRPQRVIFPLLVAQNDEDDEPQIVLGNPIHSNDNGNDAPLADELDGNADENIAATDEDTGGASSSVVEDELEDDHDGFPCSSSPNKKTDDVARNGYSSSAKNPARDDVSSSSSDFSDGDDMVQTIIAEQRNTTGGFSPGSRRLFRKRRLSARRSSDLPAAESSGETSKRRSLVQVYVQGRNARLATSASTSAGAPTISITPTTPAPSSNRGAEGTSSSSHRIITSAPPLRIGGRLETDGSTSDDDTLERDEPSTSMAPSGAPSAVQPVPAAIVMDLEMVTTVQSLGFYPSSFQRYLNFDRPL